MLLCVYEFGVATVGDIYNTTPALKAQGTSLKREGKDCKIQKSRKSVVRLCLLEMAGKLTYGISTIWLPKQELNNGNTNRPATSERGIS